MIRCKFDRVGRTHDLALDVDCEPESEDFLDAVYRLVQQHCNSSGPSVMIYVDGDHGDRGSISIEGGRSGSGMWTVE